MGFSIPISFSKFKLFTHTHYTKLIRGRVESPVNGPESNKITQHCSRGKDCIGNMRPTFPPHSQSTNWMYWFHPCCLTLVLRSLWNTACKVSPIDPDWLAHMNRSPPPSSPCMSVSFKRQGKDVSCCDNFYPTCLFNTDKRERRICFQPLRTNPGSGCEEQPAKSPLWLTCQTAFIFICVCSYCEWVQDNQCRCKNDA